MDVLNHELVWVGKSCYRVSPLEHGHSNSVTLNNQPETLAYIEEPEDLRMTSCTNEGEPDFEVEVLDSGKYRLRLPIPKIFWPQIIGQKGSAKRRVEGETRTTITIPKQTQEGDVIIMGYSERDVLIAKSHLDKNCIAARRFFSYTHFLSVSLVNDDITSNFEKFKNLVLGKCPSLAEKLFNPPERLHLTLVVLCLIDNKERQRACEMFLQLASILREKIKEKKIEVTVRGLDSFNDDPSKTSVLYAKVEHPLLQEVANCAARHYHSSGWIKDRDIRDNVQLHMTVMAASNLIDTDEKNEGRRRPGERLSFDARPIFEDFKDYYFGKAIVTNIQLSQMGAHGPDGYYVSSAQLDLYT